MRARPWTDAEVRQLLEMQRKRWDHKRIAAALRRHRSSVAKKLADLGPVGSDVTDESVRARRANEAFCAAMRAAINSGAEHATVGVTTEPGTENARPVHPPAISYGGSCADF